MSIKGFAVRGGIKTIENLLKKSFTNNDVSEQEKKEQELIQKKMEETGIQEIGEVYKQTRFAMSADEKVKARTSLLLASGLGIVIFIINTVIGYIG